MIKLIGLFVVGSMFSMGSAFSATCGIDETNVFEFGSMAMSSEYGEIRTAHEVFKLGKRFLKGKIAALPIAAYSAPKNLGNGQTIEMFLKDVTLGDKKIPCVRIIFTSTDNSCLNGRECIERRTIRVLAELRKTMILGVTVGAAFGFQSEAGGGNSAFRDMDISRLKVISE